MIKYGYLIIGIAYLLLSLFYIKETKEVFSYYMYPNSQENQETHEKVELTYNAVRYTGYFILYIIISLAYILSHWYE
ncbi:hypothetical protein QKU48_gp1275 [Fadolivirus algeromassiliense]|jgi:hypothetical protein|uniref:Uncharacterized protein n=1 Tax=Fadolivirus FV1/VV64 TaxID=3070911 RepID=A0A7D3URK0_9VIRU|nr:hypothetical protein QKU48_gp1275 [Fadolivirus algeromassiliense]QKF94733.1 hypothetical protein Fadolivirus_1_1275 [Fadolivirus FV1/VV64]